MCRHTCGYGGIGRRDRFRFYCQQACRFKSCYPQCLESLGEESPRLFFLAGRGEKCLELLGVGKSSRSNLEAFGQGETGKVSYSISVAFVALTSLLRAICRERGIFWLFCDNSSGFGAYGMFRG